MEQQNVLQLTNNLNLNLGLLSRYELCLHLDIHATRNSAVVMPVWFTGTG
jgi:hypothetical protein